MKNPAGALEDFTKANAMCKHESKYYFMCYINLFLVLWKLEKFKQDNEIGKKQ